MKQDVEKIACVTPSGDLWFNEELLPEIISECLEMDESVEKYERLFNLSNPFGNREEQCNSLEIARYILTKCAYRRDTEKWLTPFCLKALELLGTLCDSQDEYIWEVSSQLYSDYSRIVNNF